MAQPAVLLAAAKRGDFHTLRRSLVNSPASEGSERETLHVCALELLLTSPAWAKYPENRQLEYLSLLLTDVIESWPGSGALLELLAAHGADLSQAPPGRSRHQPLIHAVNHESSGAAVMALARLGVPLVGELTLVHRGIGTGSHALVDTLLRLGADPRACDPDENATTPLYQAAERGLYEIVETLLERGCVDLDAQCEFGKTPLAVAAQRKAWRYSVGRPVDHVRAAEVLLERGARTDICCQRQFNFAPLHWAVQSSDVPMVHVLLTHGADSNLPSDVYNQTPAHLIVKYIHEVSGSEAALVVLDLLVEHDADLLSETSSGVTPIMMLQESPAGRAWLESPAIQPHI